MSTARPLEQLKVAELKEELKKRGLSLKGIKKDLFERLDEAIRKEQAEVQAQLHVVHAYGDNAGHESRVEKPPVDFNSTGFGANIDQPPQEIYSTTVYHYDATSGNPEMGMGQERPGSDIAGVEQDVKNDDVGHVHMNSNVHETLTTPVPEYSTPAPAPALAPEREILLESDQKPVEHQDTQISNVTEEATDVQPVSDPAPSVVENTIEDHGVSVVGNNVDVSDVTVGSDVSPAVIESVNRCEDPVSENLVSDDNVNKPILENVVSQSETVMQDIESSEKSNLTGLNVCNHSEENQENSGPTPNNPTEQQDLSVGNIEADVISNANEEITEPLSIDVQNSESQIDNEKYPAVQDIESISEKSILSIEQSAQKENLVSAAYVSAVPEIPDKDLTKPMDASGNQDSSEPVKQDDRMDVDNETKVVSDGEEKNLENESKPDADAKLSAESPDSRPSEDDSHPHTGQKRKEDENKPVEPVKRVRRWNSNNQLSAESAKPLTTDSIKETSSQDSKTLSPKPAPRLIATTKSVTSSDKSNSEANGNKRTVPPPVHAPTTSLKIDRFVRPFTLKAVKDMLSQYGELDSFWMDQIKTHCYITYKSVEQATAARNGVYNTQWPPTFGNLLTAEFVEPIEVKMRCEGTLEKTTTVNQSQAPINHQVASSQGAYQPPAAVHGHQNRLPPPAKEKEVPVPKKEPEPQVPTLDDLFFKTKAKPHIYYLPLTDEQVASRRSKEQSKHLSRA